MNTAKLKSLAAEPHPLDFPLPIDTPVQL
ncbi:uncharacterized protein METZ01_LOCUS220931, partial [marine metagenome]